MRTRNDKSGSTSRVNVLTLVLFFFFAKPFKMQPMVHYGDLILITLVGVRQVLGKFIFLIFAKERFILLQKDMKKLT